MTKRRTMAGSAVFLAVFALFSKIIGAFYRVPLTNILGAEGMGMYQLVFSIYALVLSLTTGGIPLAVSRIVAEKKASGGDTITVLRFALLFVTATAAVIAVVLIFAGRYIALLQGNAAVSFGYTLLAPSVLLVSAISMFRGWFQGNYDVVPTAVSQLIEQVFKLIFGLVLAYYLSPRGTIYAVYGALAGVAISELAALLYIVLTYAFKRKKLVEITTRDSLKATAREIYKTSIIFAIAGFIVPFSQFIDGIFIVNILKATGAATADATSAYGLYSGTVMSVVNMPVVLTISLSVALIPVIGAGRVNRDLDGIVVKCATSIKLAYVIGLPAALLIFVYARPIVNILYPRLSASENLLAVNLLRICCFSILFAAEREIYASLLMALDKTKSVIYNSFAAVIVKTSLTILLLCFIGITGAAYGTVAFGAVSTLLNVLTFNKMLGKKAKLLKNVSTITLSGAIMTLVAVAVYYAVPAGNIALITGGVLSATVYLFCLMLFKVFDEGELNGIPLSRLFDKLSIKIRFWEKRRE